MATAQPGKPGVPGVQGLEGPSLSTVQESGDPREFELAEGTGWKLGLPQCIMYRLVFLRVQLLND